MLSDAAVSGEVLPMAKVWESVKGNAIWDIFKEGGKMMLPFLAGLGIREWVVAHTQALMWLTAFLVAGGVAFLDRILPKRETALTGFPPTPEAYGRLTAAATAMHDWKGRAEGCQEELNHSYESYKELATLTTNEIDRLKSELRGREEIESYRIRLEKAQLLITLVSKIHSELITLGRSYGKFTRPLGYDSVPRIADTDKWTSSMLQLEFFRKRYSLLFDLVSSANIIVKDPVPPNDSHTLLGFPNEAEFDDVSRNIELYLRCLRVYIATAEEKLGNTKSN